MDTNTLLIAILLFLLIILILVIVGLVFFVFKLSKKDNSTTSPTESFIKDPATELKKIFDENRKKEQQILGLCSICEKELYKGDHFEVDHLHFCKVHFETYSANEWVSITNQRTTADTPEAGIYIYNFKKDLWEKEEEPTYILSEYKIDVVSDQIETYVQLYVIKEKEEELKKRIDKEKLSNE